MKESSDTRTNRCLSHDLAFAAVVDAELQHHKAMKKAAKKEQKNEPVPNVEEQLIEVFRCSKQWCYRCRRAWKIVTGDQWAAIFAHFYGDCLPYRDEDGVVHEGWRDPEFTLTITVDVIDRWERDMQSRLGRMNRRPKRSARRSSLPRWRESIRHYAMCVCIPTTLRCEGWLRGWTLSRKSKATGLFHIRNGCHRWRRSRSIASRPARLGIHDRADLKSAQPI